MELDWIEFGCDEIGVVRVAAARSEAARMRGAIKSILGAGAYGFDWFGEVDSSDLLCKFDMR